MTCSFSFESPPFRLFPEFVAWKEIKGISEAAGDFELHAALDEHLGPLFEREAYSLREEDIYCLVNKFGTEEEIMDNQYLEPKISDKFGKDPPFHPPFTLILKGETEEGVILNPKA